jgi:hypothetical protein
MFIGANIGDLIAAGEPERVGTEVLPLCAV